MATNYIVKPGDSLSKIAANLGVSIGDISGYSSGNPNLIRIGENLTVNPKPLAPKAPAALPSSGDMGGNEIIGAGPNAGMTVAESDKLHANDPAYTPSPIKPIADPQRPGETTQQYQARILSTPFLYRDKNSGTGYSTTNQNGTTDYVPTLSTEEANAVMQKYGIYGTGPDYVGLTTGQAKAKAEAKKKELLGAAMLDNNNSFFSVTQLGNIKKSLENLALGVKNANNDPWKTNEDKTVAVKSVVDQTTSDIAQHFDDPQKFINDYSQNPQLSALLSDYIKAGGSVADISNRISENKNGSVLPGNNQDVATYLQNGKKSGLGDNVYANAADAYLGTQRQTSVDEINRLAKVPKEYIDLYYGTPEKQGIFQKVKADAQSAIDTLTTAYKSSKQSTSDEFDYQIQKNNHEAEINAADLEQKRLQAKNYLTEKLASIGALITTGAAPEALANLDVKYQTAQNQALQSLQFTNNDVLRKKTETLTKFDTDLEEKIQTIKSQTDKTQESIDKEILQAKTTAAKAINTEIDQFNTKAQSVYKEFLNTANKSAQQYIRDYLKTVGGPGVTKYSAEFNNGLKALIKPKTSTPKTVKSGSLVLGPEDISSGEQKLEAARGADHYVDSDVYKAMYDKWIREGGLVKDFIAQYPPKNYVNPANTALPSYLRPAASKAAAAKSGRTL